MRELALVGARHLAEEEPISEERRNELMERFLSHFEHPETAPWDWDVMREGKRLAWPVP